MPLSDYGYESAIGGDDPAAKRADIIASATPQPPAPPIQDHPMVQFARNLMSPMTAQQTYESGSGVQPAPAQPFAAYQQPEVYNAQSGGLLKVASDFGQDQFNRGPIGTALGVNPAQQGLQQGMPEYRSAVGQSLAGGILGPEGAAGKEAQAAKGALDEAAAKLAPEVAPEVRAVEQAVPIPEPPPSPERPPNLGVNLDTIDAPQPVKDLIEQTATENAGFEAQRRGVVSVEETMADAAKAQVDAEKYAFLKPGTALNAEQLVALKGALVSKGSEVVDLQEKVRAAAAVGVKSDELNLRLILASTEHQSLQRAFAGVRAESGRALRIQREISGALSQGTGAAYDKAIEAIGGRDKAGALVDRLQKIWTDPTLDATARELSTYKFIQNLDSPRFFDRLNSLWVNSILSSPVTHAVNVTGQTVLLQADIARTAVAAGAEAVTTLGGTLRPREVFFTQPLAEEFGAFSGLGDGFKRAWTMLRTGVSPESMTKFAETGQIGQREVNAGILNAPLRALGAEDQVFYAVGYSKGLKGAAATIASRERQGFLSGAWSQRVSDLLASPTEEMLTKAEASGKRAGLRTDAGVAPLIRLRDAGIETPLGKFSPLRYVIPFLNTPTLLVKIGAEYSPLGFIGAVRGATGATRSEALAGALLGSTAMGFLASKYAEGLITGDVPPVTDPAGRDAFYASGKIPYAVKIGNEWVSFNRLEPIATPLKWTAALLDAAKVNRDQPADVVASKMGFALAGALKNETYLSSLSDLIDAFGDPKLASKFFSNIVGGFVPAAVRVGVQANDPIIRQPNGIVEQIEATLPGLNQNVAPKINVYGEAATRSQGKQGIAGVVSPVDFNAATTDPVTEKVNSLHLPEMAGQPGVKDLQVGYVSKEIASYRLNPDEASRYQQYAGQATHNLLTALFADQRPYDDKPFSKLTPVDQIRAVRKTIDDARTVGRAQVADEIVHASTVPLDIARGADMRLSTLSTRKDKAYFLEGLVTQGKLSGDVKSYLDSHSDKGEPTVNDYLKAAPLVRDYLALAPYTIGNPTEWTALAAAKKEMTAFLKATPAPLGWPQLDWFQAHDPTTGTLVRRYSYDSIRNPKRTALLKQYPFLDSFLP